MLIEISADLGEVIQQEQNKPKSLRTVDFCRPDSSRMAEEDRNCILKWAMKQYR
jgi:hypothetical protein